MSHPQQTQVRIPFEDVNMVKILYFTYVNLMLIYLLAVRIAVVFSIKSVLFFVDYKVS